MRCAIGYIGAGLVQQPVQIVASQYLTFFVEPHAAVVKVVVAFLLAIQAAFSVVVASLLGAVIGLRCTSSIGFQLRVEPDQRFGLALRAAA